MEPETVLNNLEKSVKRTDSHLDKIVWKLDECEKEVTDIECDENKESVLHLLETVTQVKQHYENLRKEISEVQELQRQVQDSLRDSTMQVQTRCRALRMKLIGYHDLHEETHVKNLTALYCSLNEKFSSLVYQPDKITGSFFDVTR